MKQAERKATADMTPSERREYYLRTLADMSADERSEMRRLYARGPTVKLADDSCDCDSADPPRTCLPGCPALRGEREDRDWREP